LLMGNPCQRHIFLTVPPLVCCHSFPSNWVHQCQCWVSPQSVQILQHSLGHVCCAVTRQVGLCALFLC
jgi:hypothetical protein